MTISMEDLTGSLLRFLRRVAVNSLTAASPENHAFPCIF